MATRKKRKSVKKGRRSTKKVRRKKPARKTSGVRKSKSIKKVKKPAQKKPSAPVIGVVTHYFPKVNAAVIKLKRQIAVGDSIALKGSTTNFEQTVESMQIDHAPIQQAKKGDEIGILVNQKVRKGYKVFKK